MPQVEHVGLAKTAMTTIPISFTAMCVTGPVNNPRPCEAGLFGPLSSMYHDAVTTGFDATANAPQGFFLHDFLGPEHFIRSKYFTIDGLDQSHGHQPTSDRALATYDVVNELLDVMGIAKLAEALGISVPEDTGIDLHLGGGCANLNWDEVLRVESCGEIMNGFSWMVNATGSEGLIFTSTAELWAGFAGLESYQIVLSDLKCAGLGVRRLRADGWPSYQSNWNRRLHLHVQHAFTLNVMQPDCLCLYTGLP